MFHLWITLCTLPVIFFQYTEGRAENVHLVRQKQILDLYLGVGNVYHFPHEDAEFPSDIEDFKKPEVLKTFIHAKKRGFLPHDAVFSTNDKRTKEDTILLFDVFYFAKDFETFHKVACWARKNLHPEQFMYAFTLAVFHRDDCHTFLMPPLYEVLPSYFAPVETMLEMYNAKMLGLNEGKFTFNNTGYEYNYHENKFGGPLDTDATGHSEHHVSYVREDVGLNAWFVLNFLRFPHWMHPEKYSDNYWYKRGENFYYTLQQLFAMYSLQRLANGVPYVETLEWEKPIKVGYNPRVACPNGKPLYHRPDYVVPKEMNTEGVARAELGELRLTNAINSEKIWDTENTTLVPLNKGDGTDLLARMFFGMPDVPNGRYYGNHFAEVLKILGYTPTLADDHELLGNAMSIPPTALRDPAFYQFLSRLLKLFQVHKRNYPTYTPKELGFTGVKVKDFDVDKFLTYFEMYNFELTNAVPMKDLSDYDHYSYYGRQFRLNHKPYTYNVKVYSEIPHEAMVRVFLGPKYDDEEHLLSLEQRRLAFVELDRFHVKLTVGENVFERYSKESPLFSQDPISFRPFYRKVSKTMKNSEPYYVSEGVYSGMPDRFQLPRGWSHGQPFVVVVIVTPYKSDYKGEEDHFYANFGSSKLYDTLPLGFPFDRPVEEAHFDVPNILFKDVLIYHKDEHELKKTSE